MRAACLGGLYWVVAGGLVLDGLVCLEVPLVDLDQVALDETIRLSTHLIREQDDPILGQDQDLHPVGDYM